MDTINKIQTQLWVELVNLYTNFRLKHGSYLEHTDSRYPVLAKNCRILSKYSMYLDFSTLKSEVASYSSVNSFENTISILRWYMSLFDSKHVQNAIRMDREWTGGELVIYDCSSKPKELRPGTSYYNASKNILITVEKDGRLNVR